VPVLKAEPQLRTSRLALYALSMHALVTGLDLLGIESPETM
jgi:arginyl-tRNA synthetase